MAEKTVKTRIPARMDRLPWSGWHWLVIVGAIASRLSSGSAT